MGNNSSGDNTICNNTILTESSEESVLTSLLVGATVPITINSNDTYGNAFVTNRDGGSSAPATANIGVSVHMVSGTMIIDNVQGLNGMDIGTASIAPGMAVYGTDAILRSYVGQFKPGGTPNGLYSMWTTDCGAASISGVSASMCPLASPTGGIFNNTEGNFSPSYSNSMTSGVGGYVLDLLWATVTKKVLYKTNWIDPSGASLGILSTGNGACKNGSDLTGNVNMLTGDGSGVTVWSTTPGPGC
jgi:hypothetical protein